MIFETLNKLDQKTRMVICFKLIIHFKDKYLKLQKDLKKIINIKYPKIEKESKKFITPKNKPNPNASIFFNGIFIGKKNKHKLPNGVGSIIYKTGDPKYDDNDMFFGEFKSGLRNGIGKYTYFANRNIGAHPFTIPYYLGEWHADLYYGLGKKIIDNFNDEMFYEGEFSNDKITGFGNYHNVNTNSEMIGYFADGSPVNLMFEIHKDKKGNLSKDKQSGIFEHDHYKKVKNSILPFKDKSIWEETKIPNNYKLDKGMYNLLYNELYCHYIKWDQFSKVFKNLKLKLKERIMILMNAANEYFYNNSKDKKFMSFLTRLNELKNESNISSTIKTLRDLEKVLKKKEKEFAELRKELKKP